MLEIMATKPTKGQALPPKSKTPSRDKMLEMIEAFLAANPKITPESFGWRAIKNAHVVARLRGGGDITTGKMDAILSYLLNPR